MKKIYTDGACKNNPGKGGWAYLIIEENEVLKTSYGCEKITTNQKMEMKAVIEALKFTKEKEEIEIYSDSAYIVNCFKDNWIKGWKKNGWLNSKKQPVANKELWEEMDKLISSRHVSFVKVKGHSDNEYNNRVDKMASDATKLIS